MASAYPGAVDALVRPDGTDPLSDGHAALHNATSDAVEAVQTELGTTPSGSAATVAARFTAAESATADAQADATTALADAATADGKAVTAQATADAAVSKATYDAHSVLAATIDDTPAAVTVAEQTLLGRKTGGNIAALTVAEGKTLLGLGTAAVVDVPASGDATSGQAVKGSDSRLSDARTPTAHKASHESGGSDAVTLAPAQITGTAVVTADARLSDARTPTAHKTSHQSGGSDEVTLAQSQVTDLTSDLGLKAPLASPTLTGVPTAPTAAVDTNTTQVATTAFTVAQINAGRADDAVAKSAVGNLLTANQASIESDTTGWNTPLNGTYAANTTLARNATIAADGSASVQATAVGAGIFGLASSTLSGHVGAVPVTAGQTYTFSMYVRTVTGTAPMVVLQASYWAGESFNSYSTPTVQVAPTETWQRLILTVVIPAGVTHAALTPYSDAASAGDTFLVDKAGIWEGAGGQWALPGTPITNLGFYTDESVGRRLFQWDANNSRFQQTFGDTGWRAITASLENGWSAAAVYLRRTNSTVELVATTFTGAGASSGVFYTLPTGYAPISLNTYYLAAAGTGATTHSFLSNGSALTMADTYTGVTSARLSAMWTTTAAWPTTLPGSAVGSIPA